ncbi:MAG: carboxypeptidase-like regulatory domain-containing protein [Gemmataceae bacterium]
MQRFVGLCTVFMMVVLLPGCKMFDRMRGRTPGETASRDRSGEDDPFAPPKNWYDKLPSADRARGNGNARNELGDLTNTVKGIISGVLLDPEGNRVPYQDIAVEATGELAVGSPLVIQTDKDGYFLIRGLKPNQGYSLSVKTKLGGRELAGQTIAKSPSPVVRLQLREDLQLPPGPGSAGRSSLFDNGPSGTGTGTGGRPLLDAPGAPRPIPLGNETSELPFPKDATPRVPNTEWNPSTAIPNNPATPNRPPPRGDLVAPGPATLERPPVVNIPGPLLPPPNPNRP